MRSLGYGPDKPLQIKIATRNIAGYRDPAIIMIDHLSQIFIAGEIDVLDTSVWYTQLARKDFTVAMNVSGIGIADPAVVFYEGYACGSQRNYRSVERLLGKKGVSTG